MVVPFCPSCNTLLILNKKNILECEKCGKVFDHKKILSQEKEPKKEPVQEGVVSDENVLASYHHTCKKCGYNKAEIIDMGEFYSDGATETLLKCGKCGWSEHLAHRLG